MTTLSRLLTLRCKLYVYVCLSVCVCLMIGKTCHGCLHNFPHRTLRNPCSNLCITLKLLLLLLKLKLTLSSSDAAAASSAAFLCLCVKRFSICQTKTWLSQQWNTSPPCPQHPTPTIAYDSSANKHNETCFTSLPRLLHAASASI